MKYEKALDILPEHVVKTIQQYIDGSYIYIPRKSENRRSWGEQTGSRRIWIFGIGAFSKVICMVTPSVHCQNDII